MISLLKETDFAMIKTMAKVFAHLPVEESDLGFIVHHPFSYNPMVFINNTEKSRPFVPLDIRKDDDFKKWVGYIESCIDSQDDIIRLLLLFQKPYLLTFIKYCYKYLSAKDLALFFNTFWCLIEDITSDKNVNNRTLIKWFKAADINYLMDEEDYKAYSNLPDVVTIYRGVTKINNKRTRALSWTLNRDTAVWFSKRFNQEGNVWEKVVSKDKILAYFSVRNEFEVIVDLYRR